jgi:hypothetical protein
MLPSSPTLSPAERLAGLLARAGAPLVGCAVALERERRATGRAPTKAERLAAIRQLRASAGLALRNDRALDLLGDAMGLVRSGREARQARRYCPPYRRPLLKGHPGVGWQAPPIQVEPAPWEQGPPAARHAGTVARLVTARLPTVVRTGAPGGDVTRVRLTDDPNAVGVTVELGKSHNVYRGEFTGWAARSVHRTVTVDRRYLSQVHGRPGLATAGGLLTLAAVAVEGDHGPGVALYRARWAAPGRGYGIVTRDGYIAVAGGHDYHADSADAALAGLRRKRRAARPAPSPEAAEAATARRRERHVARLERRHGGHPVSLADSTAVGNCIAGTLAWCARVGLDAAAPVPRRAVIAGWRREPRPEAYRVLAYLARRLR